MANTKTNRVSREGYQKLEDERDFLVTVRRSEVAEKLKEARSFGDLSENAEYDEAKNDQAMLEAKINEIDMFLSNAVIVDDEDITTHEVSVGSIVTIKDCENGDVEKYTIVGSTESDPDNLKISDESPIGKAALKKKVGDVFEVDAPIGTLKFEVLEISK
ncbi:MAG: transcription elongation factor GreA [Clostridiales bacterium]|nr:transcription elongation factor GreA [Clostridiales bacterium]